MSEDLHLLGRLAVHYKLLTAEQLAETTRAQARSADPRPLGELLDRRRLDDPGAARQAPRGAARGARQAGGQVAAPLIAPKPASAAVDLEQTATGEISTRAGKRIDRILEYAVSQRASDIHIVTGERVLMRRDGQLDLRRRRPARARPDRTARRRGARPPPARAARSRGPDRLLVDDRRAGALPRQRLPPSARRTASCCAPSRSRSRPSPSLGLPGTLAKLTNHHQGLVLLTGPAGCGKSSTLAALLRLINEERQDHIVTVEDPIEYLHTPMRCVVNQRQVGRDTGELRARAEGRPARGSRRHRDRRAARPRDHLAGAHRRRDRPPGARRRSTPAAPSAPSTGSSAPFRPNQQAADPHDALGVAARRRLAAPRPPRRRQGPRAGARGPARHARRWRT